ncbi:MAG TPA: long-chain fatty acid--CoA ligase [Alphaproteobacteria bacterium]|nr:long-chain fatty acid--CoA ligase [Alphaproteobacteria bacterium]
MNLARLLEKAAVTFGTRPALTYGTRTLATYAEFAERVARLARGLRDGLKLATGDRVGLAMTNHPDFLVVLFACWHAGLVAVPMNAKLHRKEFAYILEQSGARLAVVTPDMAPTLAGLDAEIAGLERILANNDTGFASLGAHAPLPVAEVAPDDPAWLFYTSGTTGRPKGATLTHRNLVAMTMSYLADIDQVAPEDCIIHAAPMSHGSGIYALPHVARAANNVVPESGHFDPAEVLRLIAAHPGASFFFAPTMITRLLATPALDGADLGNLKVIVYGGGPMYVADLKRALDRLGPRLVQIYGQGESPMTITHVSRAVHEDRDHPRWLERLASVGVARTDLEVRVVDDDDRPLPAGEIGEVVCRGDVVMKGYWNDAAATARTLKGGWLHTGDVGALDEDGFLTLKDRSKDMIISGGSNIYPREIEEVLIRHPAVAEASVVGRPHPDWGEEVVAFVVARPGATVAAADLDRLCLDSIARFKRPKHYRFVDALPKNNYGKVLKTELRRLLESEAG